MSIGNLSSAPVQAGPPSNTKSLHGLALVSARRPRPRGPLDGRRRGGLVRREQRRRRRRRRRRQHRVDHRRSAPAAAHRRRGVLPAAAPAAAPDAPAARAAVEPRGRRRGDADVGRLRLHHRLRAGSDVVWVEIDDDVQIRVSRAAISGKVDTSAAAPSTAARPTGRPPSPPPAPRAARRSRAAAPRAAPRRRCDRHGRADR